MTKAELAFRVAVGNKYFLNQTIAKLIDMEISKENEGDGYLLCNRIN